MKKPVTFISAEHLVNEYITAEGTANIALIIMGPEELETEVNLLLQRDQIPVRCGMGIEDIAPMVTLNVQDYTIKDVTRKDSYYKGTKLGTVGRPLYGIAAKAVNSLGQELGANEIGKLMFKGPALGITDWFDSKKMGSIDEEGFVSLAK